MNIPDAMQQLSATWLHTQEAINTKIDTIKEALESDQYAIQSKRIAEKLLESLSQTESAETA